MGNLEQTILKNRTANITRFKACHQIPTFFQTLYFMTRCNEDDEAIRSCFEAVPGDPLDK